MRFCLHAQFERHHARSDDGSDESELNVAQPERGFAVGLEHLLKVNAGESQEEGCGGGVEKKESGDTSQKNGV